MNTEALVKLRAYWDSLRNGRSAPYRAELDPRKFEDVLEHMFILEQLSPSQIRVRLAGMALCEMMGMEVRGMPPEAFIDAEHRETFGQHLVSVLNDPSVIELDLMAGDAAGGSVPAQMLLLPLRSDFGEVTRILGCVVTESDNVRAPVNFSILNHRRSVVRPSATGAVDPLPGFEEPPAAYQPPSANVPLKAVVSNPDAAATAPRRGHLRVVSADRS
ncbi:MAG: PAS domain-containing protein [Pseudomonadota bacterium]